MIINKKNINIEDLIENINIDENIPLKRKNGLVLRNTHIEVLKRHGINYENYNDIKSIIREIEDILNINNDEELEILSEELSEINYYNYTNK